MSLPGHDAALGASNKQIFVKFDNWCEKVKNLDKWVKKVVRIGKILVNDLKISNEILGDELERFWWTTKKVVRNFATRIENIFEGIQEPLWPRASNSLCTPLFCCLLQFYPLLSFFSYISCHILSYFILLLYPVFFYTVLSSRIFYQWYFHFKNNSYFSFYFHSCQTISIPIPIPFLIKFHFYFPFL